MTEEETFSGSPIHNCKMKKKQKEQEFLLAIPIMIDKGKC